MQLVIADQLFCALVELNGALVILRHPQSCAGHLINGRMVPVVEMVVPFRRVRANKQVLDVSVGLVHFRVRLDVRLADVLHFLLVGVAKD